jgi:hypothetical protein
MRVSFKERVVHHHTQLLFPGHRYLLVLALLLLCHNPPRGPTTGCDLSTRSIVRGLPANSTLTDYANLSHSHGILHNSLIMEESLRERVDQARIRLRLRVGSPGFR